jgi:hypothetical protein
VRVLASLVCLFLPAAARAGGLEVFAQLGPDFPFYNQAFQYDPGPLSAPIPGSSIEQKGIFRLDARGGLGLSGGAALALGRTLAVEARLDTADVRVRTQGAVYRVRATLPAPLPAVSTDVDLGSGRVDLQRLKPLSLNLAVRSRGSPGAGLSAGLSYLPGFRFVITQALGLGVPGLDLRQPIEVARIAMRAEALPEHVGESRFGFNAGASARIRLGPRLWLVGEGRYFHFRRQTLNWGPAESDRSLSAIESAVVRQIAEGLDPVQFHPTFFHAIVGIAFEVSP